MDLKEDSDLLFIAEEGLKAGLPPNWKSVQSKDGDIYYKNFSTGEMSWDHPTDEFYKKKYQEAKLKKKTMNKISTTVSLAPTEEPVRESVVNENENKKQGSNIQNDLNNNDNIKEKYQELSQNYNNLLLRNKLLEEKVLDLSNKLEETQNKIKDLESVSNKRFQALQFKYDDLMNKFLRAFGEKLES